jgi:hypothetical protein
VFENLKGRDYFENLGVAGKVILKWNLWKWGGRVWIGFFWLRRGTRAGPCEHSNGAFRLHKREFS